MVRRDIAIVGAAVTILWAWNQAHPKPYQRPIPVIAVIDSGVDYHHQELAGRLLPGIDLTTTNAGGADRVGHGTAMASLIAGKTLGGCPSCKILPIKVTNHRAVALERIAAAIQAATDAQVSVIYVGAGAATPTAALARAVKNAETSGIPVVAPAGASATRQILYPAAYGSVVAVAPIPGNAPLLSTSRPGDLLYRPGWNLPVAAVGGGYATASGSSLAAASMAGEIAQAQNMADGVSPTRSHRPFTHPSAVVPVAGRGKTATLQYADTDDTDIIIDAPWRTIRDYLPLLVFTPEFNEDRTLERVELHGYDVRTDSETELLFRDQSVGQDFLRCRGARGVHDIAIIDADGNPRGPIQPDETTPSFWHYIARIPVACITTTNPGPDGAFYLLARTRWSRTIGTPGNRTLSAKFQSFRVLRVVIGNDTLPRFDPVDHYYDIHVHTIAEQTRWHGITNVDAARKAFGGPLAMVVESAYALGLIETPLRNGNWSAFRDQLATTDHNVFFSGAPYDAGNPPGYGPTSQTNGRAGEFRWYRDHFGELAGEEITLRGTGRTQHSAMTESFGSHLLAYGGPHVEGPWHGGKFTVVLPCIRDELGLPAIPGTCIDDIFDPLGLNPTHFVGVASPVTVNNVLQRLRATTGFGYAAHPFSQEIGWPESYYEMAIGLPPHHDGGENSLQIQPGRDDFVFKGLQVWNEKHDWTTPENLRVADLDRLNPFSLSDTAQRFKPQDHWDRELLGPHGAVGKTAGALGEYFSLIRRGLKYSFQQEQSHRFIRKLYISAGTDAHGDFNYLTSMRSTAEAEIHDFFGLSAETASVSSNAFGRLRTYTLTGERLGRFPQPRSTPARGPLETPTDGAIRPTADTLKESVKAYREGNTVLTDGPICTFNIDSDCRLDSATGVWHDNDCRWENPDGRIGGSGKFDGGGSVLIPQTATPVITTRWDGRNDYLAATPAPPDAMQFTFSLVNGFFGERQFSLPAGRRGSVQNHPLPQHAIDDITKRRDYTPSAIVLHANLGTGVGRAKCITNPVWVIPVKIAFIPKPPDTCPIYPEELKVSVSFGVSMDATLPSRACTGPGCLASESQPTAASIQVLPLDGAGRSTGRGVPLLSDWWSNTLTGSGFNELADGKISGDNRRVVIPCPDGDWDPQTHSPRSGRKSYAVTVTNLRDMHGNRLHSIGTTFTTRQGDRPIVSHPRPPLGGNQPPPACQKNDRLCRDVSARCERLRATNGAVREVCRWGSVHSAAACSRTRGIWTTLSSKYAKNHPQAVIAGTPAACLTEANNLKNIVN